MNINFQRNNKYYIKPFSDISYFVYSTYDLVFLFIHIYMLQIVADSRQNRTVEFLAFE